MKSPPDGVRLVMEAVCVMKSIKSVKIDDPAGGLKKVGMSGVVMAIPLCAVVWDSVCVVLHDVCAAIDPRG